MEKLRRLFVSEKEKLQGRSFKEKAQYIWEYYHLWIIGIGAALFFVVWLIWHYTTAIGENWIYVAFPNAMTEMGNRSPFWEAYVEASGYDIREKNVEFNSSLYFDPTVLSGTANNYYQAFVAMTEAGTLDAVTLTCPQLEALGQSGRLLDLMIKVKFALRTGERDISYSTIDALRNCDLPVLFVHGSEDDFVPTEMSYRNYEAFEGDKELLIIKGAGHAVNYRTDPAAYEAAVKRLWEKCEK